MLYNKNNLMIHAVCGDGETRPELGGVLFKKDRTVATDAYVLIEVKNPDNAEMAKELPEDKNNRPFLNLPNKGFIIPKKSVKKALTNVKENTGSELPVLENCWLVNGTTNEKSRIYSTNIEKADIVETRNIEGNFPDVNQLLISKDKGLKILLDVKKLKQIVDVMSQIDIEDDRTIEVRVLADDKPLVLTAKTKQSQQVTAMVMPIKQ